MEKTSPRMVLGGKGFIQVSPMKDSTKLYKDQNYTELRKQLDIFGYLLIRELIDHEKVSIARKKIIDYLSSKDFLVPNTNPDDAYISSTESQPSLLSRQDIARSKEVLEVLEHPNLFNFFENLFEEEVITINYKWLRAVNKDLFTGVHVDRVYVGGGSERILTAWIPIGDIPIEMGTIVLAEGSHISSQFEKLRKNYNHSKVGKDGVQSGWLTDDASDVNVNSPIHWVSTDFQKGDVCILNLDILHLSSTNTSNKFRISCDTRWQPKKDPIFYESKKKKETVLEEEEKEKEEEDIEKIEKGKPKKRKKRDKKVQLEISSRKKKKN